MNSATAMILFGLFQVLNAFAAKLVSDEFGLPAGVVFFIILFLVSSFAIGKFASRRLIVTHEDQQKTKK